MWILEVSQYLINYLPLYHVFFQLWLFPSNPFSLDVKFDETGQKIIASRFLVQAVNISDTNHEKEMVRALRNLCKASTLNVSVFHPYFVFFDQVCTRKCFLNYILDFKNVHWFN